MAYRVRNRATYLKVGMTLAFLVIAIQLFNVQIIHHDYYVGEAEKQQTMQNVILARRGEIYMLDEGNPVPVVMNQKVWSVIVDPMVARKYKDEIRKTLEELAKDKIVSNYDKAFENEKSRYAVVARNVDYKTAVKIQEAELGGVWLQQNTKRVYPEGEMASGVLGFVNMDGVGQYGVEGALDDELNGENGVRKTVKDVNNIPLTVGDKNVLVPAVDGKNIVLTIDRNIQYAAEKAVKEIADERKADHASALVMDPATGEILAMVHYPTYDPANYATVEDASLFQTNITMDAFEPASVCKTFIISAGVNEGKLTPQTSYYDSGTTTVDGYTIQNVWNWRNRTTTMQDTLTYSLNTGSTQALRFISGDGSKITYQGKEILYQYYHDRFGLGEETGIELFEVKGTVTAPDDSDAWDSRYANMTFGQGLNVTMIQVAAGYASIVNGGDYYKPTIVAGEINDAGEFLHKDIDDPLRKTVSAETSKTMRKMLYETRAIYLNAKDYDTGAFVGGKTGTAETYDDKGLYTSDATVGTYVGFGAKDENSVPEYLVMTRIWGENRKFDGSDDAKPIFDKISSYMLNYLRMR